MNAFLMLLSGHCASNAEQLEMSGEADETATSRLRREFPLKMNGMKLEKKGKKVVVNYYYFNCNYYDILKIVM